MAPSLAAPGMSPNPDRGLGLTLLLGTDYERKKHKLQQELQLDYKHYVAMKKDPKTSEPFPQPQGLSLPIDEKRSIQEKLREERRKEYNLFLQEQAETRRLKKGARLVTSRAGQVQASDAVYIPSPAPPLPILNTHADVHPRNGERPASRRNAATLTEAVDDGKSIGIWGPGHRGQRRRCQLHRQREAFNCEEELITDEEEDMELRHRRRKDRSTPGPEHTKERRTWGRTANRASEDIKVVEAPGVHDQNNNGWIGESGLQMPGSMKTAARSRPATSKDKAELTTGLMIGATEEQMASQTRKEQYKQELLKQIAEQQRNKIREKKLELRVAATGATDPEKEPDRIKHFWAVNRQRDSSWRRDVPYKPGIDLEAVGEGSNPKLKDDKPTEDTERRGRPGKSHADSGTSLSQLTGETAPSSRTRAAQGVPSLDYFNEDFHEDLSAVPGEVAVPRVAGGPPPVPPNVTNNYHSPYDAAYYYGTRNPLDLNLLNQNGLPGGVHYGNFHSPHQRPSGCTETAYQHRASPLNGELPADKSKQRRERALSYQEALRQQIKEREERKRREKEDKERYDAKIEAEMMVYNPWGRSGGGAPIKDQKGNLVSDLNQMHRINEESYRNPASSRSEQTQSFVMRKGHDGARALISHRLTGFNDLPSPQQRHKQESYKEALKQQIEENKRKQEEESEQLRVEEEKEQKRLEEQRARIQQEYEEEQRKQKKVENRMKSQIWIHEPKSKHQREEKRPGQAQEFEKKLPESARDREDEKEQLSYEREPSPPIPTLQKKQENLVESRPSTVVSQLSSRTERTVSAPHYRPVPGETSQLQDGQHEVIRQLSALRRYLKKEHRQLGAQLDRTNGQEDHHSPPNRPTGRPFESAHYQAAQPLNRSPSCRAARANVQNIGEFNHLKHRDAACGEEVHHMQMQPAPPTDEQSLDIQRQALLREQQRKIRLTQKEEEPDFLDLQLSHYHSRSKPGHYIRRDSILPSETAFIDVYSGDVCEERLHRRRPTQLSAEQRTGPRRRRDYDEVTVSVDQRSCDSTPDSQSFRSVTSLNLEPKLGTHNRHRITRQDTHTVNHNSKSGGLRGDEVDGLSLRSALEGRVSVETVATDAWLRPGTSDAGKRSGSRGAPNGGTGAPPWLTQRLG